MKDVNCICMQYDTYHIAVWYAFLSFGIFVSLTLWSLKNTHCYRGIQ